MASKFSRDKKNYFEGWVSVKASITRNQYKLVYAQLKEQELYLYSTEAKYKSGQTEEIVSMCEVESVLKDKNGRKTAFPTIAINYRPGARLKEVRIRAQTADEQDAWFRYIHTVAMLQLPIDTSGLLPGQKEQLKDIVKNIVEKDYVTMSPTTENRKNFVGRTCSMRTPPFASSMSQCANPFNRYSSSYTTPPVSPLENVPATSQFPVTNKELFAAGQPPRINKSQSRPSILFQAPSHSSSTSLQTLQEFFPSRQVPRYTAPPNQRHNFSWFLDEDVTREEAEEILTQNEKFGNLLVRRRTSDPNEIWQYAVSIKPIGTSAQPCKHYRVQRREEEGRRATYLINLAERTHPPLHSLEDVVKYFESINPDSYKPMTRCTPRPVHNYEDTLPTSPLPETRVNEPYLNENVADDYYNLTPDVRGCTLPSSGRHGGGILPPIPRQGSTPTFKRSYFQSKLH